MLRDGVDVAGIGNDGGHAFELVELAGHGYFRLVRMDWV
jgi:hypothetical protein